jgi:hypothetical protein
MNACCENLENRADGPGPRGLDAEPPEDVTVTHCTVCECRHFEASIDPLELGVSGASL